MIVSYVFIRKISKKREALLEKTKTMAS